MSPEFIDLPSVALADIGDTEEFNLYPNPANAEINILINKEIDKNTVYDLVLYDQFGRIILNQNNIENSYHNIDISNLHSGIYSLQIKYHDGSISNRNFIKE
jgi:hypothetical protein